MSRIRVERGAKRVRAVLGGQVVADTTAPLLVWEFPYYPAYYVPRADVADGVLIATDRTKRSPSRGVARLWTVRAGEREVADAALDYPDSPIEELRDHVRFDWSSMDAWFEEDEEIFVHPRNPYTRVDILASSRHVRIELDGVTVAESDNPMLLFETGLPTRYYLPKTDVRMDLVVPSDTVTQCPYKGDARYWTFRTGDTTHTDIAWHYRYPAPESQKIAGRVAFLDERADVFVDGVRQERPKTHFG
ncbi:DUF427 domain-containing protein [Amycolatopsis sp. CA-230715]|uniref:DUF427 domain-containing protein n=1 Tax=Amycolatopsis sp. CA-230715 TaxID=2745196 RepID=UPI001C037074|nr:DUF427 domain-containing protein [Amycolatopsis sp. CA-230715]QWF76767.1 hypothetical protein HUW46_00146 [Amycolatopsis sp. CA-230715]